MGKMEIEVKVLNIDVNNLKGKILSLGGLELGEIFQRLFTYDLPTICGRYNEILSILNDSQERSRHEVYFSRMKNLLLEMENIKSFSLQEIYNKLGISKLEDILEQKNYLEILNSDIMVSYSQSLGINPNKWIRLRESDGKATLATKHILLDNGTRIQQLLETEIEVENFVATNDLLLQLGFVHKSYQEKRRIRFKLNNHEIDIDFWPEIPAFMEIEGESESDIEVILKQLGFSLSDTVSCTADEIYKMNGKDMFASRELRFESFHQI